MVAEQVATGIEVAATVLSSKPFHFRSELLNLDPKSLMVLSPQQIVVRAPVRLLTEDRLWLGHVIECHPEGEEWRTTICVEHSLSNLPELLNLAARFK